MPEPTSNTGQHLLPVDIPEWLTRAVAPWRVEAAVLWRSGGVELVLRSERARIPVLITSASAGRLTMSLLEQRIAPQKGASFVRALELRLQHAAPLRDWLLRLRGLAEQLGAATSTADDELACLIDAWRAWPEREGDPLTQVPELPASMWARASELPRAAQAALTLYRFARGDVLEALSSWKALPQAPAEDFTERHLDAIALGLLGRRTDAIASLARAEAVAHAPEAWLAIARAYEALEQREAAIAAHEQVLARRLGDWDRLRLARSRGDLAPGEPLPQAHPGASLDERISFVRELVKVLDAAGRYDDTLTATLGLIMDLAQQAPLDLAIRAAELHLWRGELAQVRARLETLAEAQQDPRAQVLLAAALVLDGHPAAGLSMLEPIDSIGASGATQLERLLWQAEAHLALDQLEQALECVDQHIILENSLVAYLLKLLTLVRLDPSETLQRSLESRTFLDALVVDVLPTLRPAEQIAAAREQPERFAALLRGILDDMAGNRSAKPTWCRRVDNAVRLEPVRTRPSGRDAAVANLIRIRSEPPDAVLDGFDAVLREYPNSPHPYTYRGELLIWLGRYEQALASFDEADARAPTRWSYVGRAAAFDLLGQAEQADHWTDEGARKFGELETATTHVYRGERLRKLGAWADARRDLELALAFKTRRIGARINLALTYRALDQRAAFEQQIERLRVDAPAFVWEAGGRADQPIDRIDERTLLAMLELMVGNRSSFLHSMIDHQGLFRVVPDPSRWIAHARLSVAIGRRELGRAIAKRWLADSTR